MKRILLFIYLSFFILQAFAQKDIFTFTITDYIVAASDTMSVVQVYLPYDSVKIEQSQISVMKSNFSNTPDTASIGWGRCQLIKGQYYYFAINLYNKNKLPKKNDLLYTSINYPAKYKGRIYKVVKNAIYFERLTGGKFYEFPDPLNMDINDEENLLDSLVADIKFTGKAMQEQNNSLDQLIKGGSYDGRKLFATMQSITKEDLKKFLDYVIARPRKYSGNTWKVSETFATWMTAGAPTVVKD